MVLVNRLWPMGDLRYKRSWRELPYRLCCFLRFVLDRLRALRWLGGFGRATRLLDRLRASPMVGRFLARYSAARPASGSPMVGRFLARYSAARPASGSPMVGRFRARYSAARPASGSPMVGRCHPVRAQRWTVRVERRTPRLRFSTLLKKWWGQGTSSPKISSSWLENLSRKDGEDDLASQRLEVLAAAPMHRYDR